MYSLYCSCILSDQDLRIVAVALPETFLCWRLSQRARKPSVSSVFTGDAMHVYVVALADESTAGEEKGCLQVKERG